MSHFTYQLFLKKINIPIKKWFSTSEITILSSQKIVPKILILRSKSWWIYNVIKMIVYNTKWVRLDWVGMATQLKVKVMLQSQYWPAALGRNGGCRQCQCRRCGSSGVRKVAGWLPVLHWCLPVVINAKTKGRRPA